MGQHKIDAYKRNALQGVANRIMDDEQFINWTKSEKKFRALERIVGIQGPTHRNKSAENDGKAFLSAMFDNQHRENLMVIFSKLFEIGKFDFTQANQLLNEKDPNKLAALALLCEKDLLNSNNVDSIINNKSPHFYNIIVNLNYKSNNMLNKDTLNDLLSTKNNNFFINVHRIQNNNSHKCITGLEWNKLKKGHGETPSEAVLATRKGVKEYGRGVEKASDKIILNATSKTDKYKGATFMIINPMEFNLYKGKVLKTKLLKAIETKLNSFTNSREFEDFVTNQLPKSAEYKILNEGRKLITWGSTKSIDHLRDMIVEIRADLKTPSKNM